ncbi:MAG: adenylate kinase [Bacteriovoracaceae bacterium]|nr:adenylate kinase [Bacteriovoracaceae bacterium]
MFRISVVGTSCSGKSTLAQSIAHRLKIKYIEQDKLFWRPNWITANPQEFSSAMSQEIEATSWTVCGNHSLCRQKIWGRATHIVWLNYPFTTVFYRALKRTCRRVFLRQECCNGNFEGFRHAFLSKNSILWWVIKTYRPRKKQYRSMINDPQFSHIQFVEFKKPHEADRWLMDLPKESTTPT